MAVYSNPVSFTSPAGLGLGTTIATKNMTTKTFHITVGTGATLSFRYSADGVVYLPDPTGPTITASGVYTVNHLANFMKLSTDVAGAASSGVMLGLFTPSGA